jgi:hypothetical protein
MCAEGKTPSVVARQFAVAQRVVRNIIHGKTYCAAPEGKAASIAAKLLVALGSMTAPVLLSCVDSEDIRPAIGTASNPARVVDALWLEGSQQLVFATPEDEKQVLGSSDCAAFIYSSRMASIAAVKILRRRAPHTKWAGFQLAPPPCQYDLLHLPPRDQ